VVNSVLSDCRPMLLYNHDSDSHRESYVEYVLIARFCESYVVVVVLL